MSNTAEHVSNGETATATTESGSELSTAANSCASSLTMTTAEETDTSHSDESSEEENEFLNFLNSAPRLRRGHVRSAPLIIAMPSHPIEPNDTSIESKMPAESFRELQITLGIIQPQPDKENMPQEELIAALREAFTEYRTWPLNALKIRLRQNEVYLKETLEIIAAPLDIEGSNGYQLKSDEA